MSTEQQHDREVLYIADPMCSWCWGFTPTIRAMAQSVNGKANLSLLMGGLRPLTRTPMDDAQKAEIRHHWESVADRSGQPFAYEFFDRDGFVYDTEPASRAVCAVRTISRPLTLDYFEAVQRAFYAENRDVTDGGVLQEIAHETGIERQAFEGRFSDIASAYETAGDFHVARQLKATGFPTVVLRKGDEFALLTAGYQPWDALKEVFEGWLSG